jgi:sulfide:quinone oxidoreductase
MTAPHRPLRVLIAGGGVAALEAALALRELAPERVATTLLTPDSVFSYRPLSVLDPFPGEGGRRYDLDRIVHDAGAELRRDRLRAVDPQRAEVLTAAGARLSYDALLIAYGAGVRPRFEHARTIEDGLLIARLRGLVQDVEEGYVRRVAFVAAGPPAWPLPLYELALMTSRAAYDMCAQVSVTIVTPERTPLAVFGDAGAGGGERRRHAAADATPGHRAPALGRRIHPNR